MSVCPVCMSEERCVKMGVAVHVYRPPLNTWAPLPQLQGKISFLSLHPPPPPPNPPLKLPNSEKV